MSPVTGNDFIATVRVRTNNSGSKNTEVSDALSRFHHFLIVYHSERMSLKGV